MKYLVLTLIFLLPLSGCARQDASVHLGYIEAEWTYVSAPAAGRIIEQPVEEGSTVAAGDFLFLLDNTAEQAALSEAEARLKRTVAEADNLSTGARDPEIRALQARLAEAKARLEKATADRDRIVPLVDQGFAPKAEKDAVEAAFEQAKAAVDAAQQDLKVAALPARPATRQAADEATRSAEAAQTAAAYRLNERSVLSPKSGRIEEIFFRPGEFVSPGAPVLSLLPDDGLKARFFVSQSELPQFSKGKTVRLIADGLSQPVSVSVTFIAHDAEYAPPVIYSRHSREKLVFMVEAQVPGDSGLHPGLPVEVEW
ncbi:MAG: HlyD family efflux transporter periplasmic adaptor subunit [Hyphomonas sp.]|uniref:HlyD family secretion protein n=1 Tax=Hyphomonas sp. TaxID=87 RepID=UPI00352770E2